MVMKEDGIREHILKLENDLVKSEVRKSAQKLNDLLADDFSSSVVMEKNIVIKLGMCFRSQMMKNYFGRL